MKNWRTIVLRRITKLPKEEADAMTDSMITEIKQ